MSAHLVGAESLPRGERQVSHLVYVMREGKIVAELVGEQVSEEKIMRAVFGVVAEG